MITAQELGTYTLAQLDEAFTLLQAERERRYALAQAPVIIDNAVKNYQEATGTQKRKGAEWVQPTSALDAYPADSIVTHEGKEWVSIIEANVWEPGVTGWRENATEDSGSPAEWVRPTGAHDAYKKGDVVAFEGYLYRSLIDANVYSPSEYPAGWKRAE